MLKILQRLFRKSKEEKWIPINEELIGKDNIFRMKFDKNWFYSISGNSFYSIHNEIDDLKGGIQISIIWNKPVVESIKDLDHLESTLKENEHAKTTRVQVSGIDAIHFATKYTDNNMDFYYWYLRFDNAYFKVTYFIFEDEPMEIKEAWLNRVKRIINTINIDTKKFETVRMN